MAASLEYISAGGNCHPSAADWNLDQNLLAFGAGRNIALWYPQVCAKFPPEELSLTNQATSAKGITSLLRAHTDIVQAVKFVTGIDGARFLVSAGADKALALWLDTIGQTQSPDRYSLGQYYENCHAASINCIAATYDVPGLIATGGADRIVKIWKLSSEHGQQTMSCLQIISPSSSMLPLALALTPLANGCTVLAVGGSRSTIQLYATAGHREFRPQATLSGHEGWVRSLDFAKEIYQGSSDVLLASASQDRYIRLWRISGRTGSSPQVAQGQSHSLNRPSLSNKTHKISNGSMEYMVMFEALLVGHEDWVYTARWTATTKGLQLLSTSADNSVAIWEADPLEGIWYPVHRFGEISAQKGSTTATGSMGGLWNGLWGPDGVSLIALARTGGWLKWDYSDSSWRQDFGVGGHVKSVRGVAWSRSGAYLLTTSADQTTRLHAQWQKPGSPSWHEFSRPQIHGYDLNCISAINDSSFVSGADEKLLRVFEEPDDVADLLQRLCSIKAPRYRNLLAADIPVLGLSNKASERQSQATDGDDGQVEGEGHPMSSSTSRELHGGTGSHQSRPPLEDYLSKRSLWPEQEKLYGHGFEVNSIAVSNDGTIVASSCKASSIDHAVIRLFDTRNWQQVHPPLKAHTLTVTDMAFSEDDSQILSVGRDRQWAVWGRDVKEKRAYKLMVANAKAHTRMILCASWITGTSQAVFLTGGRDKCVKFWKPEADTYTVFETFETPAPVLTVASISSRSAQVSLLAVGLEDGGIYILHLENSSLEVKEQARLPSRYVRMNDLDSQHLNPFAYII